MRSTRPTDGEGTPSVVRTTRLSNGIPSTATSSPTGRIREQSSGTTPASRAVDATVDDETAPDSANVGTLGPGGGALAQLVRRASEAPITGRTIHGTRRTGEP